ncbi:MAG: hypothetical protein IJV83_04710 [Clostridia bacterium]|nr:hypothetical protein [Clostridia bacterium]
MLETLKALKQKGFRSTTVPQNYAPTPYFFLFFGIFSAFFELVLSKLCVYVKKKRIFMNKNAFLVGRGGFEALPPFTALYFKGIHDCTPNMPQVNFSSNLYIFSVLLALNLHFSIRTSEPIKDQRCLLQGINLLYSATYTATAFALI